MSAINFGVGATIRFVPERKDGDKFVSERKGGEIYDWKKFMGGELATTFKVKAVVQLNFNNNPYCVLNEIVGGEETQYEYHYFPSSKKLYTPIVEDESGDDMDAAEQVAAPKLILTVLGMLEVVEQGTKDDGKKE